VDSKEIIFNECYPYSLERNKEAVHRYNEIMKYAKEYNKVFEININDLFWSGIRTNNDKIVQLLMDYTKDKNVIIDLNKKDSNGDYPIFKFYKNV